MAKEKTGDVKFVYVPSDIAPNFPNNFTVDENTIYFVEYSDGDANLNKIYIGSNQFADSSVRLDNITSLVQTVIDDPNNEYSIKTVGIGDYVQGIAIDGREIIVTLGDVDYVKMAFPETGPTIDLNIGSESDSVVMTKIGVSDDGYTITSNQAKLKIKKPTFSVDTSTKSIIVDFGNDETSTIPLSGIVTSADEIANAISDVKSWATDKFATKEYVQNNFVSDIKLDTKLNSFKSQIDDLYLTIDDAQDLYVQKIDLISDYYDKSEVDAKIASATDGIDLTKYQRVIEKLGFAEEGKDASDIECDGEAFIVSNGSSEPMTIHTNLKIATDSDVYKMIKDVFGE